jgi:uncharacterized membrane protein
MKTSTVPLVPAMAMALSMVLEGGAQAGPAPAPKFEHEKCYGVAKAGKNDCETMNPACAGTARRSGQGDSNPRHRVTEDPGTTLVT